MEIRPKGNSVMFTNFNRLSLLTLSLEICIEIILKDVIYTVNLIQKGNLNLYSPDLRASRPT